MLGVGGGGNVMIAVMERVMESSRVEGVFGEEDGSEMDRGGGGEVTSEFLCRVCGARGVWV